MSETTSRRMRCPTPRGSEHSDCAADAISSRMIASRLSRREFLALSCAAPWLLHVHGRARQGPHPTPRPGIDASHVLQEEEIKGGKDVIAAFNEVRQIPQIVDGIRCQC